MPDMIALCHWLESTYIGALHCAFIAWTVFSAQINDSAITLYCSGLAFLAAVTLTLELLFHFRLSSVVGGSNFFLSSLDHSSA